jgi:predicted RNA-binding protein with PUA-like domain
MKTKIQYWLLKSEPDAFSIDDLKRVKVEPWTGVRNYQARNNMMNMAKGDKCFFYHSSCENIGIVGICEVVKQIVDPTQFDNTSPYFDPKSTPENPRWICIEVKFVKKFGEIIPLEKIKGDKNLKSMVLNQKGSRLSVQPVSEIDFKYILNLTK